MQYKFDFYEDPSHGWLKVPITALQKLKIVDKISHYSYYRKGFVYLEEDRDMSIFIGTMKEFEYPFSVKSHYSNRSSVFRSYDSFMQINAVYDNSGITFDRYTVIFWDNTYLGLSNNPNSPQGFSQWGEGIVCGDHLGKGIAFSDMPEKVQDHILGRMRE